MRISGRAASPELLSWKLDSSTTPSSAETSFRELDDEFLQTQTRIWIGEVLHLRFDEETTVANLLADGELLFQVSTLLWKMLFTKYPDIKFSKAYIYEPTAFGKRGGRYLPYSNVDAFLKICQVMGLSGIDLFTPSDVVERRDIRRVCMCVRSLSNKARSRHLDVPDFDIVTYTIAMPTYMVGSIRRSLEQSRSSSSSSISCSSCVYSKDKDRKNSRGVVYMRGRQYDLSSEESDDAESNFMVPECQSPASNISYEDESLTDLVKGCSPGGNSVVKENFQKTPVQFCLPDQDQHNDGPEGGQSVNNCLLENGSHKSTSYASSFTTLCLESQVDLSSKASCAQRTRGLSYLRAQENCWRFCDVELDYRGACSSSAEDSSTHLDKLFVAASEETFIGEICNDSTSPTDDFVGAYTGFSALCDMEGDFQPNCMGIQNQDRLGSHHIENSHVNLALSSSRTEEWKEGLRNMEGKQVNRVIPVQSNSLCHMFIQNEDYPNCSLPMATNGSNSLNAPTKCEPPPDNCPSCRNSVKMDCLDVISTIDEMKPEMDSTELLEVCDPSVSTTGFEKTEIQPKVQPIFLVKVVSEQSSKCIASSVTCHPQQDILDVCYRNVVKTGHLSGASELIIEDKAEVFLAGQDRLILNASGVGKDMPVTVKQRCCRTLFAEKCVDDCCQDVLSDKHINTEISEEDIVRQSLSYLTEVESRDLRCTSLLNAEDSDSSQVNPLSITLKQTGEQAKLELERLGIPCNLNCIASQFSGGLGVPDTPHDNLRSPSKVRSDHGNILELIALEFDHHVLPNISCLQCRPSFIPVLEHSPCLVSECLEGAANATQNTGVMKNNAQQIVHENDADVQCLARINREDVIYPKNMQQDNEKCEANTRAVSHSIEGRASKEVQGKTNKKRQLVSVAGGMAFFGALFFLLHLRMKRAACKDNNEDTLSGQLQIRKPNQRSSSRKGRLTNKVGVVYPGERLKLED